MVREGTRSQTGNARPRVFNTVDTGPTIKRTKPTTGAGRKPKSTATTTTSAGAKSVGKGAGVVKKQQPAKSTGSAAGKAKVKANSLEKKAAGKISGTAKAIKK